MAGQTDVQVLVIGAGPTGLMAASELSRRGIKCRIVDKSPLPADKSKALVVHARTLELFKTIGIADTFVKHGMPLHGASVFASGKRIIHLNFDELDSPYPFALAIPQSETEALLNAHLKSLGVTVERPLELTTFRDTGEQIEARLRHPDGKEETITAQYLIGCDGAHSAVRHSLPFTFEGSNYPDTWALADVKIEWNHHDDEVNTFFHGNGVIACFPMGHGRVRVMIDNMTPAENETAPTLQFVQDFCDKYVVGGAKVSDPHWLTYFKIHKRGASGYRHGRALLAGDAAHIHSPVGGQGMNTGLQDAFNLAWKLALVLKGQGTEALLGSYEQERHQIAQMLLSGTDMATKVTTMRNPIALSLRNAIAPLLMSLEVVQQRLVTTGAMLTVNYRHSNIVGEHRGPQENMRLDGKLTSWLEFAHGPVPGDRAPEGVVKQDGKETTVFDAIAGTSHNLLLFLGLQKQSGAHERLNEVAQQIQSNFGDLVRVQVVLSNLDDAKLMPAGVQILVDPDGSVHHKYGAAADCFYLVRPDGYVGFRSNPPDYAALEQHLSKLLSKPAVAAVK